MTTKNHMKVRVINSYNTAFITAGSSETLTTLEEQYMNSLFLNLKSDLHVQFSVVPSTEK